MSNWKRKKQFSRLFESQVLVAEAVIGCGGIPVAIK